MKRDRASLDVVGHLRSLRRYALALTRHEGDAEDLVQDALVRAYERRSTLRVGADLRPWLMSILHNRFVDGIRSRRAESARIAEVAQGAEISSPPGQDHAVRLAQVRSHFMALPDDQRAALHLVTIEGLSYEEAARALDIPVGTLMSRLGRARDALRAIEAGEATGTVRRGNLRLVGGSNDPIR